MSKPDEEVNCYLRDCVASFTVKKAQNPKDFPMIGLIYYLASLT